MKLADALALKAREQGLKNFSLVPKLTEEEQRERKREASHRHYHKDLAASRKKQRDRYHAKKEESS